MFSQVDFSPTFDKHLKKAPVKIVKAFRSRYELFTDNPYHPLLNNHALKGRMEGYRSINITGDWRALYTIKGDGKGGEIAVFQTLGTHSQLY